MPTRPCFETVPHCLWTRRAVHHDKGDPDRRIERADNPPCVRTRPSQRFTIRGQHAGDQANELTPLRGCQRCQNLLLDVVDDGVQFPQLVDTLRGEGDDVATLVVCVHGPFDEPT